MKKITFVLYVEDDADDRDFFVEAFKQIDDTVKIEFADNGMHALSLLNAEKSKPDVIFCDIIMPVMDGIRLLKEIKLLEGFKMIPIVIYTASPMPKYRLQADELGASGFIQKPDHIEKIFHEISRVLKSIH